MSEIIIGSGNINTGTINAAHTQIKDLVTSYTNVKKEVNDLTQKLKDNWCGMGRNEFEAQYEMLLAKINDFGNVLTDIYDALVLAEASYESSDDSLRQKFVQAISEK